MINLILCWTQPGFGADCGELSLLFVLWYVACSGNETNKGTFERNSDTENGAQDSRFVGGSGLIPTRLAALLGSRVALCAVFSSIAQSGPGTVTVHHHAGSGDGEAGDRRLPTAVGAGHRLQPGPASMRRTVAGSGCRWAS